MVEILEENAVTGREYVKKFSRQMLKNSIFIGTFHEKRFVECLNGYRDVISICKDEKDFIKNVKAVKRRIQREFIQLPWIGITDPHGIGTPAGYNLWVELPIEVFGKYWFKVKNVEFLDNQISLKLEVLRPIANKNVSAENMTSSSFSNDFNFNTSISQLNFWMNSRFSHFYNEILTYNNIKSTIIFSSLLLTTFCMGCINIVEYLLEYLLKLINELSKLIHSLTPIIINLMNLCVRTIFGLFHLIATLFKRQPPPQPVYNAYIQYDPNSGTYNPIMLNQGLQRALPHTPYRKMPRMLNY